MFSIILQLSIVIILRIVDYNGVM